MEITKKQLKRLRAEEARIKEATVSQQQQLRREIRITITSSNKKTVRRRKK